MKTLALITVSLLCLIQLIQAQNDSIIFRKAYQTWIYPMDKSRMSGGIIFEIKDSSMLISDKYSQTDYELGKFKITKVDASSIDIIKVRKKGNVGVGLGVGAAAGILIGGTLTAVLASSEKKNTEEEVGSAFGVLGAVCLTGLCVGIGAAVGSAKQTIHIKGNQELFTQNKSELNSFSIKQNMALAGKSFSKLPGIVSDIDGNKYHTLALGGQVWMAENLKTTNYSDGSKIFNLITNELENEYSYDWFTVNHDVKICPAGWHIPSINEWNSLINSLGQYNAGNKMEEDFSGKGKISQWWTSTEVDSLNSQSFYLNNKTIGMMITKTPKTTGLSVRCLRD
jgi:hypothetical protein